MNEQPIFNSREFVLKILKEIPFFEIIPLPADSNTEIVFNVKTTDVNEASRIFYRNNIPFTTIVEDENKTYLEANIRVRL